MRLIVGHFCWNIIDKVFGICARTIADVHGGSRLIGTPLCPFCTRAVKQLEPYAGGRLWRRLVSAAGIGGFDPARPHALSWATPAQLQVMAVETVQTALKASRHFVDLWRTSDRDLQDGWLPCWADRAGRLLAHEKAGTRAAASLPDASRAAAMEARDKALVKPA